MILSSMKSLCSTVALLISSQLFSQQLNEFGHFITIDNNSVQYTLTGQELKTENRNLKGTSVFRTASGYITLTGNYENASSDVRIYSAAGEELFVRTFLQIINFSLSESRKFCAFHDTKNIHVLDVQKHTVASFEGSNVFAVDDEGRAAYYNDKTSTINYNGQSILMDEPVYRVLFFNGRPLFVTMKKVLALGSSVETIFAAPEGRIFDIEVFDGKMYVSTKKEIPGEFIFTAFVSSDLLIFAKGEEKHYPLERGMKKPVQERKLHADASLTNEMIRNPLYYYNDTVYQPIGNSYDEIQEYSGAPYAHGGVDLLGYYQQDVRSVKDGYVKAILTTSGEYHWRIAIANNNTSGYSQGYLYAHIEETTFPFAVGDPVQEADVVGKLVDFPVAGFVHCHFARIGCTGTTWSGNWWTFDNPLSYMSNHFDSIAPTFQKTIGNDAFAFRKLNGVYLSPDSLYGNVRVISKVYDRINASWRCDVHELRYSLSPLASPQTILLDSFAFAYHYYNDHYFNGPYYNAMLRTIYSRDATCFSTADYQDREFYHIVTNSDGNDTITANDSLQAFNTLYFIDGSYIFRVTASDPSGNTTTDSMIIKIINFPVAINESSLNAQVTISPNPFADYAVLDAGHSFTNATLRIENYLGQTVKQVLNISGQTITLNRDNLSEGLYFIRLTEGENVFIGKMVISNN
jgi:hypothetical protein